MTNDRALAPGFVGRFLGSWRLAVGELVIVSLGVLIALWADQAIQARQESAMAIDYLESLQKDIRADINALRFSSNQARNRLAITRQVDAWLRDPDAAPDPDSLVINAHCAGVTFTPTISKFTIEELKSIPEIGATRADADRILARMRARPNFKGYLRDGMYWAHLSAQLLDGVAISAEELDAAIGREIGKRRR